MATWSSWRRRRRTLSPRGDTFSIVAGCDKKLSTCRDTFGNVVNFRGFPFMPGNDPLIAGASGETRRDGGSRGIAG